MDLYLLPGLGADGRLFDRLELSGHVAHRLDWPAMPVGSSLCDFAKALSRRVDATRSHALIGVSLGGMVAQELAAITKPERTIIISSWKGPQEMPLPIRMLRGTHAEKLLTAAFMKRVLPLVRYQMGLETPEDIALFDAFVAATPLEQIRVQIAAVLAWEGPAAPVPGLVHVHGDMDRLMPIANVHGAVVIREGGHFMVCNKAALVSAAIQAALGD